MLSGFGQADFRVQLSNIVAPLELRQIWGRLITANNVKLPFMSIRSHGLFQMQKSAILHYAHPNSMPFVTKAEVR